MNYLWISSGIRRRKKTGYRRTDQQTTQLTDTPSYRDARMHLKSSSSITLFILAPSFNKKSLFLSEIANFGEKCLIAGLSRAKQTPDSFQMIRQVFKYLL